MTAATFVLWSAAVLMFGFGPAFCLALWLAERRDRKADEKARAEQDRRADAEWLAILKAAETPIYAQVWAESLRRDLEEWA